MSHNILITGASGYLGGSLLAQWQNANLPPYGTLYALVRSEEQGKAVKQYGAEPFLCDLDDHEKLQQKIISDEISIIFFLVDSASDKHQPTMIRALHEVKSKTGKEVHFLHTGGAKHFSSHAGLSTEKPLLDTDPDLYNILKDSVAPHPYFAQTTKTNFSVIDLCEEYGVRGYIFAPCIVYGKGEGFGKKISIQVVEIVKAAHEARRVYDVNGPGAAWPVCHIADNSSLYLDLLRNMLLGTEMGYNKRGFYLAASGSVHWNDIYRAFAVALAKRGIVDDDVVTPVNDEALKQIAEGLGVSESFVPIMLGGNCTFTSVHGGEIGWKAQYPPEHIIEVADEEVDFILKNLGKN